MMNLRNANQRRAFTDVSNSNRNGGSNNHAKQPPIKKGGVTVKARPVTSGQVNPSRSGAFSSRAFEDTTMIVQQQTRATAIANPESYQMKGTVDNIDERDKNDPLCVTSYVNDMYAYFHMKEESTSVRPVYMESQPHINEKMRAILIDWLIEVHLKFKLVPDTLYLTVNLIDRYLERKEVSRAKLQLIGVSCLLVASKYEEIYPPELRDLVYICDRAYTRQDIIDTEEAILKTLEYNITIPSAHAFLVRMLKAGHADRKIVQLSCFLLDSTLLSYHLLHFLPSQLAAAAVYIARRTVGRNGWSPTLLKYGSYCEEDVIPVAKEILNSKDNSNPELKAVNKKYANHKYGSVANTTFDSDF